MGALAQSTANDAFVACNASVVRVHEHVRCHRKRALRCVEKLKDISLIFGKEGAAVSVGAEAGVLYLVHGGCFRGTALRIVIE